VKTLTQTFDSLTTISLDYVNFGDMRLNHLRTLANFGMMCSSLITIGNSYMKLSLAFFIMIRLLTGLVVT